MFSSRQSYSCHQRFDLGESAGFSSSRTKYQTRETNITAQIAPQTRMAVSLISRFIMFLSCNTCSGVVRVCELSTLRVARRLVCLCAPREASSVVVLLAVVLLIPWFPLVLCGLARCFGEHPVELWASLICSGHPFGCVLVVRFVQEPLCFCEAQVAFG